MTLVVEKTKDCIIVYMGTAKTKKKTIARWDEVDRQGFADGNRLRAQTIPNKKRVAARKACRDKARWN